MRRYTVQEFTDELSSIISATYDDIIAVSGEVSNFSISSARHIYFTLKDSNASLKVVYFKQDNSGVSAFIPKNGDKVEVLGNISVYKADGSYQLVAKKVTFKSVGNLYEQYMKLKERLEKEGLFDDSRKKPIALLPKHVALITSKNGAALTDFITVIKRNKADFDLTLYAVPVQGEEASKDIIKAIKKADELQIYDVIVLMRGGGSFDELALFNNEQIALAISEAKTPIISAIGHERDVTIADFIADKRAATPTAAANILSEGYILAYERLGAIEKELNATLENRINNYIYATDKLEMRLNLSSPTARLKRADDNLTLICNKLKSVINERVLKRVNSLALLSQKLHINVIERKITDEKLAVKEYVRRMRDAVADSYEVKQNELQLLNSQLQLLNPYNVLNRGYAVVKKGERFITTAEDVLIDDIIDIRFKDGSVRSKAIDKLKVLED